MAEGDQVRGYILFSANQPAAFELSYVQGTTMAFSQIGFPPAFAELSPGITLLCLILERQFAEGQMEFCDLMEGSAWAYKARFVTVERSSVRLLYFPRNTKTLLLVLLLYALRKLEHFAGMAQKMVRTLLERLKKLT